jgi:hypothetical protein
MHRLAQSFLAKKRTAATIIGHIHIDIKVAPAFASRIIIVSVTWKPEANIVVTFALCYF